MQSREAKVYKLPRDAKFSPSYMGKYEWEEDKVMVDLRGFLADKKSQLDNIDKKTFDDVHFYHDLYTPLKKRIRMIGAEAVTNAWLKIYEIFTIFDGKIFGPKDEEGKPFSFFDACSLPGAWVAATHQYIRSNRPDIGAIKWDAESWRGNDEALTDTYGIVKANPDRFDFGEAQDGDIQREENLLHWEKKFAGRDLSISDCGISVTEDYNMQESMNAKLNYAQTLLGLLLVKKGGSVIFKTYTSFEPSSRSLLYILSSVFDEFYLVKPLTSRPGNSEVYMVGLGFRGVSSDYKNKMMEFMLFLDPSKPETIQHGVVSKEKIPKKWLSAHTKAMEDMVHSQALSLDSFVKLAQTGITPSRRRFFDDMKKKATDEWLRNNVVKPLEDEYRLVPPE